MQSITRQSRLCPLPRSPSWPIQEQTCVFPLQFSPGLRDWWQDKEPMMRDNLCSHTHNANARWSRTLGTRTCHELAQPVGFTVQAEAPTTRAGKEATRSPLTEGRTQGRPVSHPAVGQPQREVVRSALPPATYGIHFLRPPVTEPMFSSPVKFQQNSRLINARIRANDLEDGPQGTPQKREDTEGLIFHI